MLLVRHRNMIMSRYTHAGNYYTCHVSFEFLLAMLFSLSTSPHDFMLHADETFTSLSNFCGKVS